MIETAEVGIAHQSPSEDVQAALLLQLQQVEEVTGLDPEQLLKELEELQAAAATAGKAQMKPLGSETEEFLVQQVRFCERA